MHSRFRYSRNAPAFYPRTGQYGRQQQRPVLNKPIDRDEIMSEVAAYSFKFEPKRSLFRAINKAEISEIIINTSHPTYTERVGASTSDLYQTRLKTYVSQTSAHSYALDKFPNHMLQISDMRFIVKCFAEAFANEWIEKPKLIYQEDFGTKARFNPTQPSLASTSVSRNNTKSSSSSTTFESSSGTSKEVELAKTNLYVCGIPREWSADKLQSLFAEFGEILSVKLWNNRRETDNGNAGSGFVQFKREGDAALAVASLNNKKIGEMYRPMQVRFANSMSKKNRMKIGENIYVAGLPPYYTDQDLNRLFEPFGTIESVLVLPAKSEYVALTGFVRFATHEEAYEALKKMHRATIEKDFIIACSWAKDGPKAKPNEEQSNIYVAGINRTWNEQQVKDFFGSFGPIQSIAMFNTKSNICTTFVKFLKAEDARKCVKVTNGIRLPGTTQPLTVRFSKHQEVLKTEDN